MSYSYFSNPFRQERAAGIVIVAVATQRVLVLRRADTGLWSIPGGHREGSETPGETAIRETYEETGIVVVAVQEIHRETVVIEYVTFVAEIEREVIPRLNEEHTAHRWANADALPQPTHPGLWRALRAR